MLNWKSIKESKVKVTSTKVVTSAGECMLYEKEGNPFLKLFVSSAIPSLYPYMGGERGIFTSKINLDGIDHAMEVIYQKHKNVDSDKLNKKETVKFLKVKDSDVTFLSIPIPCVSERKVYSGIGKDRKPTGATYDQISGLRLKDTDYEIKVNLIPCDSGSTESTDSEEE